VKKDVEFLELPWAYAKAMASAYTGKPQGLGGGDGKYQVEGGVRSGLPGFVKLPCSEQDLDMDKGWITIKR
jgi:hypothetical protein